MTDHMTMARAELRLAREKLASGKPCTSCLVSFEIHVGCIDGYVYAVRKEILESIEPGLTQYALQELQRDSWILTARRCLADARSVARRRDGLAGFERFVSKARHARQPPTPRADVLREIEAGLTDEALPIGGLDGGS